MSTASIGKSGSGKSDAAEPYGAGCGVMNASVCEWKQSEGVTPDLDETHHILFIMNRILPTAALSLSLCALLATLLLWRDVRAWRQEAASPPLHHRLTDEQFARVKNFVDYIHTSFDKGTVPRSEVWTADHLLIKARFMRGDISREEWYRLSIEAEPRRMDLDVARLQAGAGTIDDILLLYDDVLESSR